VSLLEAQGVGVRLGGRDVLRDVDFRLEGGGLVGLIGPNGAGKTTLARCLAGLQPLASGGVRIDDTPLAAWPRHRLARVMAYLPQGAEAHWEVTVEVLVGLGRLPWRESWGVPDGADRAAIDRALRVTELEDFRHRSVRALSGGERARVMLARALAGEPRLLLADEPVANLDPYHRLEVMEHLAALADAGTGVVVVLHDLTLASRFCRRLVLLHEGRVHADGPPLEVVDPVHLRRCFRVEAHLGRLEDGPFIIPTARINDGGMRP